MRQRLLTLPAGRRAKWAVMAVWLLVMFAIIGGDLATKFDEAQQNESSSFLPGSAESTAALLASESIQGDEKAPIVVVYRREGGLTRGDFERIDSDRETLNADLPPRTSEYSEPIPSPDENAALIQADISADGESETILDPVDQARELVVDEEGLDTAVAGGAAISADAIEVFESIDGALLLATGLIVFILLLAVYRSPIFWFFPLLVVIFAELASRGIGYGLTEIGVTVNGQSAGILPVLVFGAGTDYALLLVARYREELRRHGDKHDAMAEALRRAGPAILASGLTVIAALLCLVLADVEGTSGLGPIGATGIAVAMVAMLTALPALLVIAGRWAFWPFVPHVGDEAADETHGIWRRIGDRIAARPRAVWGATIAFLLILSLGWLNISFGLTQGNQFRDDVESVAGQELLAQSFPAGASAPTEVIVRDPADQEAVTAALLDQGSVEDVRPVGEGPEGALLFATLTLDPYSTEAFD
ncbi:MAG: MMPL family transporter, partial [Actinomycetota bacterium]|nr:MMPL family transporter [Actinomycetota bacterium]